VLFDDLERWLTEITGFDAISLQLNACSQGKHAGILVIREEIRHIEIGNVDKQNDALKNVPQTIVDLVDAGSSLQLGASGVPCGWVAGL
jgi:hypothetical protein